MYAGGREVPRCMRRNDKPDCADRIKLGEVRRVRKPRRGELDFREQLSSTGSEYSEVHKSPACRVI